MAKKKPVVKKDMIGNAVGGKELYVAGNCSSCHGMNGNEPNVGLGAKDLTQSKLVQSDILQIIGNGKNAMPGYRKTFTQEQLNELALYVESLRSPMNP